MFNGSIYNSAFSGKSAALGITVGSLLSTAPLALAIAFRAKLSVCKHIEVEICGHNLIWSSYRISL